MQVLKVMINIQKNLTFKTNLNDNPFCDFVISFASR
jgi:hypothetical protein